MKNLFAKPKFYFLAIAPLLLATAIIKVDCPTCHSQGSVVGSNYMDAVRIVSVEDRIIDSLQDACTGYIVTKARPVISAFNVGSNDATGWLAIELINTDTNEHLAKQYLDVRVSGSTTVVLESLVVFAFYSSDIPPQHLCLEVSPLTGTVPDPICNGTGKVSINSYFLAQAFNQQLFTSIQNEIEFWPEDLSHGAPGSKEWMDWNEISY